MTKVLHFKSKKSYNKYVAHIHIHKEAKGHGPYPKIIIKHHIHKVKHSRRG